MKRNLVLFLILVCSIANAQKEPIEPAYKRFPTVPALQLLMSDSATVFKKQDLQPDKPLLLMLFSPECSHCNHTADEMETLKDSLQDIQIVMATMYPIWEMKDFAERHRLNEWKNVTFGKDIYYILPSFYEIKSLPYMAFYDKKGNLISVFEGSLPINQVIRIFQDHP